MNAFDFANQFLRPYHQKDNEIIPTYCPYCHGGKHKDKNTFALNAERLVFVCKRGSCGRQGHFSQLCTDFGVTMDKDNTYEVFHKEKKYKTPNRPSYTLSTQAEEYLKLRKITKSTLDRCGVSSDKEGNIRFNFYDENGNLAFAKYRPSHKVDKSKGERKAWRDEGTKPILYLMNLCTFDKPLIITEGEIDALSVIECGIDNAVSVPSGVNDLTFLDTCHEWLNKFKQIILFADNDNPGQELTAKLIPRLGEYRISVVPLDKYQNCKDCNELLFRHGTEAVKEAIESAKPVPVAGLLDLADISPLDFSEIEKISSGFKRIDNIIGGFMMGQLTVWSGKRGEGKSTFLGQMLIESIEQGYKVCAYSGELQAQQFQYMVDLQCAGPRLIEYITDPLRDEGTASISSETCSKIHSWYKNKFFLYDNTIAKSNESETILQVFEYAVKRYDCKVFLVDNLMTVHYSGNDSDFYHKQSALVGDLVTFAKKYNVHVHLVAHPRKTANDLENDDIAGSGDIPNRADNVIAVKRLSDEEQKKMLSQKNIKCNNTIRITKNRFYGKLGEIGLNFDNKSRRFYPTTGSPDKQYSWTTEQSHFVEVEDLDDLPW